MVMTGISKAETDFSFAMFLSIIIQEFQCNIPSQSNTDFLQQHVKQKLKTESLFSSAFLIS